MRLLGFITLLCTLAERKTPIDTERISTGISPISTGRRVGLELILY